MISASQFEGTDLQIEIVAAPIYVVKTIGYIAPLYVRYEGKEYVYIAPLYFWYLFGGSEKGVSGGWFEGPAAARMFG
jgi:hypothetical protein